MSQTIADGLQRIINAKTDIDGAIETKGGTVTKGLENSDEDIMTITNQYTQADEGKVVSEGNLIAQTAMPDEITENSTIDTTFYNSVTVKVPARGYNHGGVNFFDVDGAILYSYTPEEFLELTEMPPNPDRTYDWLTAQGWNWTLSDAKTYVNTYGALNIGQHYITIDGKTAIHVLLPEGCLNPQLGLYLSGTVDIDWGDETEHETLTGASSSYKYATHTYAEPGRYYILITVTSGTAIMKGGNSANKLFCKGGLGNTTPGNESKKYTNCIQDIHIGSDMDIGTYAFYRCYSMTHVSIPSTVRSIGNSTFQWNSSLQAVVIPEGVTALGTSTFEGCYGLRFVSTPKSLTSIGQKCFSQCFSIIAMTFSDQMTSVDQKCFVDCPSCDVLQTPGISGSIPLEFCARNRTMMDFVIPEGVTSIGQDAFTYCYGIMHVTVPSTLTSTGTNAFSYCQALNTITFPNTFTTMGASTFENCSALQTFTIPSDMTSIPQKAFKSCASLGYIVIPEGITEIGAEAFSGCAGLSYVKFVRTTPPTLANANVFSGLLTDCVILVPGTAYTSYITGTNYPTESQYTYLVFGTYTSGASLPEATPDSGYSLVWYASMADAVSETNPITVGNGNEVYARATALVSVSRYVDFPNNTTFITGSPSSLAAYTGINRCNVADDGTINAYYGDAGYTEDGSNGQVMVKIPKFYYKVIPDTDGGLDNGNIRKCTWKISDSSLGGYTLHPAFYDANGNEIDYFLYGAFDAVGQRDSAYGTSYNTSTDKLSSVAGSSMLPVNNLSRSRARIMATNRGTGWYSAGVKQTMAVQMLMAVEYGFNSQIGIGQGAVSASAATYAGQTTGNVTSGTQDNKTTPVNWRGIENFWGNINDWIDGLNLSNRVPYFCNSYTFVDDTATGYTQISFSLPSSNYITALGYDSNNPWVMLPSESSSTSNPTGQIGDYVASYSGWCITRLGGSWSDDSNAGALYWNCASSSVAGPNVGARVMFVPSAV